MQARLNWRLPRITTSTTALLFPSLESSHHKKSTCSSAHFPSLPTPLSPSLQSCRTTPPSPGNALGLIHSIPPSGAAWNPATQRTPTPLSASFSGRRHRPTLAPPPVAADSFGTTPPGPPTLSSGSPSSPSPRFSFADSRGWYGCGSKAAGSRARPPIPSLPAPSWSPGADPWGASPVGADASSNLFIAIWRCLCLVAEILDLLAVLTYLIVISAWGAEKVVF